MDQKTQLKPQDLRAGNLFYHKGKIITIHPIDIFTFEEGDWKPEPIPLTQDMLLRFGFEWQEIMDRYKHPDAPFVFSQHPGRKDVLVCFIHNFSHGHIKYVHQLQNAFHAVTGTELTLKP